jgi:hypothetical protein
MESEITFDQIIDFEYNNIEHLIEDYDPKFFKYIDDKLINLENMKYFEKILKKMNICPYKCNCKYNICNNIIFIYSNKKTGSTSLWSTFNIFLRNYHKIHIHNNNDLVNIGLPHLKVDQLILMMSFFNKQIFVFDIYRPIFDIMTSYYIMALPIYFQRNINDIEKLDKNAIIKRFHNLRYYIYGISNDDNFLNSLNSLNINKQFTSFDHDKKYIFFENKNIKYYKLRLCDYNEWASILSNIFKTKIRMIKSNETSKKPFIGNIYKYFKENIYIDSSLYDLIINNKSFLFYYNYHEREKYLENMNIKINNDIPEPFPPQLINFYISLIHKNESFYLFEPGILETNKPYY